MHDASLHSKLEEIYAKPKYYSTWYLDTVPGNCGYKGSTAEQNHSSVTYWLGRGGAWSIAENISELCNRNRELTIKRNEFENN